MLAEGSKVIERVPHGHPGVEGHGIRDIGQAGFHCDFVPLRIHAENANGARCGSKQVQETANRCGFSSAVTAKEAITRAWPDAQAQIVYGIRAAIFADEPIDFDDRSFSVHVMTLVVLSPLLSARKFPDVR